MNPGYTLNERYKIIRSLGEGGMANVYLAHDLILDRDVSVKLLRLDLRDDPHTKRRFQREAMAATQLNDPHIVGVYDVGEDHGLQYLVMEYVNGTDLKEYINEHFPIAFRQVIEIMKQILSAVEEAHQHGIIHRDLKPQNVLIDDHQKVKITDFGIAVAVSQNSLTQTNTLMGSVHYLSPEQARGSIATPQSDVYSLGIILYELLTGKVPFEGETAVSIALKHFRDEIPSVRDFDPRIPQPLENVVLKATAKQPNDRYQSASEMAADLTTSLAASRENEPRFVPSAEDQGETKVIDQEQINKIDQRFKKADTTNEEQSQKVTKKKRRKWPWLLGLLILIIAAASVWLLIPKRVVVPDMAGVTRIQAQNKLHQQHLKLGTITKKPSETIKTGHVIASQPKSQRRVKENTRANLILSTGHRKVTLKNYVGNDYSSVAADLRDEGMTVKKVAVYSDDVETGAILKQSIKSGKKVNAHSTNITFNVSAGKKQITLPDFTNKTTAEVQKYADNNQLQLTTNETASDSVAEGHVISQSPTSGTKVAHGDSLTVSVAKTKETSTTVQVNVPFDSSNNQTQNRVQIYIQDANHNLTQEFQDVMISQDTTINIPFTFNGDDKGAYKVIRDGKTIMSATNIQG